MSKYPGNIITTGADTGYSVFFDGTGDYLSVADNAALDMGASNFTVELWIYPTATPGSTVGLYSKRSGNSAYGGVLLQLTNTLQPNAFATLNGSSWGVTINSVTGTCVLNAWNHIAFTRSGSTWTLWLNGASIGSNTSVTGTIPDNASAVCIGAGAADGTTAVSACYISNVRAVKGTAIYTAAFTRPTQLLNITNTSLLTCNSPAIIDQSSNTFAITTNGDAKVSTFTPFVGYTAYNPALGAATPGIWTVSDALQAAANRSWNMYDPYFNLTTLKLSGTPVTNVPTFITDASTNNFNVIPFFDARSTSFSPFSLTTYPNSGSVYLDGTNDALNIANNAAFDFGSGNFTVEAWVYPLGWNSVAVGVLGKRASTAVANQIGIEFSGSTGIARFAYNNAGSEVILSGTTGTLNAWQHIAVVRNGNTLTMYQNGVSTATAPITVSITANTSDLVIGAVSSNGSYLITGYISNVRLVKGVAVYTGNFTVPTAPLTATQPAGTNIAAITGTSTSLLTVQNSQSSNNNSFLDSSSNNFLITRNGNTTQGTFTPFSQTGWSNYFPVDGTTRLLAADAAKYYVGSGDFTIEGFVYIEKWETGGAAPGYSNLIFEKGVFGTGREMRGWFTPTTVALQLNLSATATGSYTTFTGSVTNNLNTWYHFAFVRTGGNLYIFRDGQLLSTTAVSGTVFNTSESMAIGGAADGNGNIQLNGHLSNFRIITGQALATSTFTPPTSPLTTSATGWLSGGYPIVLTGTVGLLTCQSNCFLDTSASPVAITVGAGTPSVQAFSPFQTNVAYTPVTTGGSGYFNYSGASYLSITTAATNYYSALGDWTWEAWVYPLSFNGPQYSCPIMASSLDSLIIRAMPTSASSTNLNMYAVNSSNSTILGTSGTSAGTITINQWSHVVLQRRSGQFDMFLNGSRIANDATQTSASIRTTDTNFLVGAGNAGTNPYWNGYISGVRIQNGSAKYTGTTYTIPTAPPSPTGSAICMNFTNAGIVDTTAKNVLETVADARISTAVSKFGGSAMLFDGTGDALFEPTNTSYGYGTGDFTIEFWVNLNSLVQQTFVSNLTTSTTTAPHIYYKLNTGVIYYTGVSGTGADRITGSALVTGTWYHIAVCRASGNTRMFINGVQTGSTYADTNNYGTTNPLGVGDYGAPLSGSATMNGYMQDLRITKFARYTTTFTPPTSLLQNQ